MDRRSVGVVEAVIVVKGNFLSLKIRRGRRLVDAQYVPASRFGVENPFQFRVVVKPRHDHFHYKRLDVTCCFESNARSMLIV